MSAIIDSEKKIAEIFKKRNEDVERAKEGLTALEEAIADALRDMEQAVEAGDDKAYRAAKQERQEAVDSLEMGKKRLAYLDAMPLIEKAQYDAMVAAVMGECSSMIERDKAKVIELVDQISGIADSESMVLKRANMLLQELQVNVYRNADRPKLPNGNFYPRTEKRVDDFSVCEYARTIAGSGYYHSFKGEDPRGPQPVVVSGEESHRRWLEGLTDEERERVLKMEEREEKAKKGGVYGIW